MKEDNRAKGAQEICVQNLIKNIDILEKLKQEAVSQEAYLEKNAGVINTAIPIVFCKMNPSDQRTKQNYTRHARQSMHARITFLEEALKIHNDILTEVRKEPTFIIIHTAKLLAGKISSETASDPYWLLDFDHPRHEQCMLQGLVGKLEHVAYLIESNLLDPHN